MTDSIPCNCDFSTTGHCFLNYDRIIHELNRRLIKRPSQLGWYAFAQEETVRLHEKGDWMEQLGVENVCDIECETGTAAFVKKESEGLA